MINQNAEDRDNVYLIKLIGPMENLEVFNRSRVWLNVLFLNEEMLDSETVFRKRARAAINHDE